MNTVNSRALPLTQITGATRASSATNADTRPADAAHVATSGAQTAKDGRTTTQSIPESTARVEEQSDDKLRETVDQMNQAVQSLRRELQFSIDDRSGEMIIKVVNVETKEIVRQIPREEVLNLAQSLHSSGKSLTKGTKV
jgi:flagellar protein FlaG